MFRERIGAKFTLMLSIVFLVGIVGTALMLYPALVQRAQAEISYRGQVLIELMRSVRHYTSTHVNPLFTADLQTSEQFIPEMVPAFSARMVFDNFRSSGVYQNYLYKEATENPTNLPDLADDFELDLIGQFRNDPGLTELSGFAMRGDEYVFYSARPLAVSSVSCLQCHGHPSDAPRSVRLTYGTENGYGWNLNDIIAAQTIYVPASEVYDYAMGGIAVVMGIIVVIFALVIAVTHILVSRNVVQPIQRISALAHVIESDGFTLQAAELSTVTQIAERHDELGWAAKVIAKMAQQVYQREQTLKREVSELQLRIDKDREKQLVEEVTESEYFRQLQQRVKDIRRAKGETDHDRE